MLLHIFVLSEVEVVFSSKIHAAFYKNINIRFNSLSFLIIFMKFGLSQELELSQKITYFWCISDLEDHVFPISRSMHLFPFLVRSLKLIVHTG